MGILIMKSYSIMFEVYPALVATTVPEDKKDLAIWLEMRRVELLMVLAKLPKGTPASMLRVEGDNSRLVRAEVSPAGRNIRLFAVLKKDSTPEEYLAALDDVISPHGWRVSL
jgi:hypothetical protein